VYWGVPYKKKNRPHLENRTTNAHNERHMHPVTVLVWFQALGWHKSHAPSKLVYNFENWNNEAGTLDTSITKAPHFGPKILKISV